MTETNENLGETETSWQLVGLEVAGHTLGVSVTAVALLWLAMPIETALPLLGHVSGDSRLMQMNIAEVGIHVGLALALWGLIVFLYSRFKKVKEVKTVKLQQTGAVLAETIVVLPVMLLLIFGLAQVAVNNIAGMLANVAAYEGARNAWVWAPEVGRGRGNSAINTSDVDERGKIAAALVMTPVAPGDYRNIPGGESDEFENVREVMLKGQFPIVGGAMPGISSLISGAGALNNQEMRFSKALDESSMMMRSIQKFSFAYASVEIASATVDDSTREVEFELEYLHHQAFPVVGLIFGERLYTHEAPNNRPGRYLRIKRKVRLPVQKCPTPSGWGTDECPPNNTVP
ncbi:MAG: TadE family protein [Myxococcota bacterium]